MDFSTPRLWFSRLVMVYAFAINAFLGVRYVSPAAETHRQLRRRRLRRSEVAEFPPCRAREMFTALAATALYGLLRPKYFLACLSFIVLLTACIVAARGLYGMAVDGVTRLQLSELRDEGLSWVFFVLALLACPRTAKSNGTPASHTEGSLVVLRACP